MMNGQVPDLQTVGELGMDLGVRRERERASEEGIPPGKAANPPNLMPVCCFETMGCPGR